MSNIAADEILRVINALVGPVDPVGETNADAHRLERLKVLCEVTVLLTDRINTVWNRTDGSHMYSLQQAHHAAGDGLADIIDNANVGVDK